MSETHNNQEAPRLIGHHKAGEVAHENGEPVLAIEDDIPGKVDALLGNEPEEGEIDFARLAQGFRENLRWCFVTNIGRRRDCKSAFLRFVAMTAVLYPEAFKGDTYAKIAKRYGCTAGYLSQNAGEFSRHNHMKFSRSKPHRH